jgi:RNA polymerase sigma factor (sigma-70 family)
VLNPKHPLKRLLGMTKSPRRRERELLLLIEDPARAGEGIAADMPALVAVESFEDFYRREFPGLLVLARALAGDVAAEDVAQESMVVTYRDWSRISVMRSPVGYVRGICTHKAVSATRRHLAERRAVRRAASGVEAEIGQMPDQSDRFWAEVRQLPSRQAQAVALYYALDLPIAEVATTLGCAEGTVKAHLFHARTKLAPRLENIKEQR